MRLALSAINLFAWIFVFQFFFARSSDLSYALLQTALLYALMQAAIFFVTPYSAMRLRNGVLRPMTQGILFAAAAYAALAATFSAQLGAYVVGGVIAFALFRGLYRALYWVPYRVDVARGAPNNPHLRSAQEIAIILMPGVCGLILTGGLMGLYIIICGAVALLFISALVLRETADMHEGYAWGYFGAFKNLKSSRHRFLVSTAILDGISGTALLLFWPIAIFLIVGWSYPVLGIVMSLTYLVVFFTRPYVRTLFRSINLDRSALVHAALAGSSWILRLAVSTPLGVILVDSYFYTGTQVRGTGVDASIFEQLADGGSYVDEYTTLKEMSLSIGKIFMCLIGVLLAATTTLPITFIGIFAAAALASGGSVYLVKRASEQKF